MSAESSTSQNGLERIFALEVQGGTLIITARADLGSLQADIEGGLETVVETLGRAAASNVVLDFANSQYFGTAMLGAMVKLWKRVCTHQGRMALCNVSDKILEILHVTKLHAMWPIYASREDALRAIG